MTVSTEAEIAHARDVTITECQERLRDAARAMLERAKGDLAVVADIPTKMARHFLDAAMALETLRLPTAVPSETRMRIRQAGELAYRITTAAVVDPVIAGGGWEGLVADLWNVLRLYELAGKEGG
jgi:hypothetical protein